MNNWWPEKWRPKTLIEYVADTEFTDTIQKWIDLGEIPHLLFYSEKSGTGKTSIAKIIANAIDADILYINASEENNIEMVRDKIKSFVSTTGFSTWKIVILDEFKVTTSAQLALNNIMEEYSDNARFIITTNHFDKIISPIKSRCTSFHIVSPPKLKIALRLAHILSKENIEFTKENVVKLIDWYYPDQRAILNEAYRCSTSGALMPIHHEKDNAGYLDSVLEELINCIDIKKTFTKLRQIIADAKVREFEDLFRFLYDNIDRFPDGKRSSVIYNVAEGQYRSSIVNTDPEIQVAQMFINIMKDLKGQ